MITFEEVWEKAQAAALEWDPMGQNHDPEFIKSKRCAYAYGFCAGYRARERADRITTDPTPAEQPND